MGSLGAVTISGAKDLERKLQRIASEGGSSVSRAAMSGAVVPLKKQIRTAVNAMRLPAGKTKKGKAKLSNPTALKRAARQTIGSSVKKNPVSKTYGAKAGFGVGKPTKAKKAKASERAKAGRGVGLSAANIHWATLGTKKRRHQSGHPTGSMPAFLAGLVPQAAMAAKSAMLATAGERAKVALKKEALKRR